MKPHDQNLPSGPTPRKKKTNVLRLGVFVRGSRADLLNALALKYDTQPGRVANRLLCDALDLVASGNKEGV